MWIKDLRLLCSLLLFSFSFSGVLAQQRTLTGQVKNKAQEPLYPASVKLIDDSATIIRFALTNQQGKYTLTIPAPASPLWLEVSYVGYKKARLAITAARSEYDFILQPDGTQLDTVTVRLQPSIRLSGDTLKYYVAGFADKDDRSIGDVLRRMPGIEIMADGTIYFNGQKVENLYIHGDDLMDGRYSLATKVIRKEMIERVDVISHHQPIRVLQDKVFTDKTAINLVLKDENSLKLTARLQGGAGLPGLYEAGMSPVLLNKRIKMLQTLAVNNSGVDYRNELASQGAAPFSTPLASSPADVSLSMATIGPPDLPLANYYFNRSGIIHLNNLYNTSKGLQLKANIQGYIDRNSLSYFHRLDNYTQNDTITYLERQSYINKPAILNAAFTVMANRTRGFFNNVTRLQWSKETGSSAMDFNEQSFTQQLRKNVRQFSNDLRWMPALRGKGIGEFGWQTSYRRDRQLLSIGKDYYATLPGQEGYYDAVQQQLTTPTFSSHAYAGYKLTGDRLNQEYKIGFMLSRQPLATALHMEKDGQFIPYAGDDGNDLHWNKQDVYVSGNWQYNRDPWRLTLQLPLTWQHIRYSDPAYNLRERTTRLLFTPSFQARYTISTEQFFSAGYERRNNFGDLSHVYRGALLSNYRMLQANAAGLLQRSTDAFNLDYSYQQSIKMFFSNVGITYDRTLSQTVLSTRITDNIQQIVYLPYENRLTRFGIQGGLSQYLFALKTTASLKARFSRMQYVQFINDALQPFYSNTVLLTGNLLKKPLNKIHLSYQPNVQWSYTRMKALKEGQRSFTQRTFRFDQYGTIGLTVLKKCVVEATARHSYSRASQGDPVQYFFLDSELRYRLSPKGIDCKLQLTNLFNVATYTRYSLSANQAVLDQYFIRGRMAMLRIDYYL
ncbi:MAG: carboxypeptidase-like regulatory domain-containing protein [Niastella sp.]|nr:carboxypeptidase-like regulatory domain-containing protein [Niastella sp.]